MTDSVGSRRFAKWLRTSLWVGMTVLCASTVGGAACAEGPGPETGHGWPDLAALVRVGGPLSFCGEPVPLDNREVRERLEKELLLTIWDRPQVMLWLKRSTRYFPAIEQMLKDAGFPEDIKYVAIAESALRAHAGSPKGAIGFWQFMPATGRRMGLRIDSHLDERRNLRTSTDAAIRYLSALYAQFQSWTMAAAAYNMGEAGLQTEVMEQGTDDYYALYLPLETQRFLFRILSAKMIFSDPLRYGFRLEEEDFYPPVASERVQVACAQAVPIRVVAQAAGATFKLIKDLNPELRGYYLESGTHEIAVPEGAGEDFQHRFEGGLASWSKGRAEQVYTVRSGDNLSIIAERFNVPLKALLIWNRLDMNHPIQPGQRLVIYQPGRENSPDASAAE